MLCVTLNLITSWTDLLVHVMLGSPGAKVGRVQVGLCQLDVRVRGGQSGLRSLVIKIIIMMIDGDVVFDDKYCVYSIHDYDDRS